MLTTINSPADYECIIEALRRMAHTHPGQGVDPPSPEMRARADRLMREHRAVYRAARLGGEHEISQRLDPTKREDDRVSR